MSLQKCQICEEEFDKKDKNMRDYCHYRGAARNKCNLTCRKPLLLPVIFQNLQGHGSRLFIKQLSKTKHTINSIFCTEEKYISFTKKIKVDEYKFKKKTIKSSLSILKFDL